MAKDAPRDLEDSAQEFASSYSEHQARIVPLVTSNEETVLGRASIDLHSPRCWFRHFRNLFRVARSIHRRAEAYLAPLDKKHLCDNKYCYRLSKDRTETKLTGIKAEYRQARH
jgi:hypothetical protein